MRVLGSVVVNEHVIPVVGVRMADRALTLECRTFAAGVRHWDLDGELRIMGADGLQIAYVARGRFENGTQFTTKDGSLSFDLPLVFDEMRFAE